MYSVNTVGRVPWPALIDNEKLTSKLMESKRICHSYLLEIGIGALNPA